MAEGLQNIPDDEKVPFLSAIAWLSNADGEIDTSEVDFVVAVGQELGIEPDRCKEILERIEGESLAGISAQFRSDVTKNTLMLVLLNLAFADGVYDARERAGLRRFSAALGVAWENVELLEQGIAEDLAKVEPDASAQVEAKREGWSFKRVATVTGVTLGAGALLAVTGGAAAPVVGGFIGSTFLGLSGAAATSAGLALLGGGSLAASGWGMAGGGVAVASAFGLAGLGIGGSAISRRTGDVQDFEFEHLAGTSSHVLVAVSGFLSAKDDFAQNWRGLSEPFKYSDRWSLRWESEHLLRLGKVISGPFREFVLSKLIERGALSASKAAAGALMTPMLASQALRLIDNPYHIARDRAVKSGAVLADCLRERVFGARPVSLVGFSLGTRLIVEALRDLGSTNSLGLVDSVYLLGGATPAALLDEVARAPVMGQMFNVHASCDLVLKVLFQTAELTKPIGLQPIDVPGVIDVDVSQLVDGHMDYAAKMTEVFAKVSSRAGSTAA